MHKSFLLLTLSTLLPACLEPNMMSMGAGDPEESSGSDGGEPGPADAGNETDGDDSAPGPGSGNDGDGDSDDEGETGTDDGGESGGDETPGNCDLSTHACISNVPEGWNGPIARLDAANEMGCAGAFAQQAFETYQGVMADPAVCECECGAPEGGSCASETIVELYPIYSIPDVESHNQTTCEYQPVPDYVALNHQEAIANDLAGLTYPSAWESFDVRFIAERPLVAEASSCATALAGSQIPEPQFVDAERACAPEVPFPSCDADTMCVPNPGVAFEEGVCIWAEGDVACPAGTDFVNREVRNTGVIDDRTCSACSCSDAVGETCDDATLYLWYTAGWLFNVREFSVNETCTRANLENAVRWLGITVDPGEPSGGSCTPQGGNPQGGVQPEAQITVCCT